MASKSDEEFFSADSLEHDDELPQKKKKQKQNKLKPAKKRPKSYLEMYQTRLACEFLKYKETPPPNEGQKYDDKDIVEQKFEQQKDVSKNSSKIPRYLWSNFVAQKNQHSSMQRSQTDMLKKRLEYGTKMSSMNRLNQKCLKLHRERKVNSCQSLTVDNNKDLQASKIPKIATTTILRASLSKVSKELVATGDTKLLLKLESLKIQHQNDKRRVEKIRRSLMIGGGDGLTSCNESLSDE